MPLELGSVWKENSLRFRRRHCIGHEVGRNHNGNGFTDDLGGRVAEQPLRAAIPAADDTRQVFADDGASELLLDLFR